MRSRRLYDAKHAAECQRIIQRNAAAHGLHDPSNSSISNLLQRMVNETFRTSLQEYDTPALHTQTLKVLNQYVLSRKTVVVFVVAPVAAIGSAAYEVIAAAAAAAVVILLTVIIDRPAATAAA